MATNLISRLKVKSQKSKVTVSRSITLFIFQVLIICWVYIANAQTTELLGLTSEGGKGSGGLIFKINSDASGFDTLYCFNKLHTVIGYAPIGHLVKGSNDKWYGIVNNAGSGGDSGALFSFDLTIHNCNKVFTYCGIKGKPHYGSITQASNGKLYITTSSDSAGSIVCYNPVDNNYIEVLNFDTTGGKYPFGGLLKANDGKLYGMTAYGGAYNNGELYYFNTVSNSCKKVFDFNGNSGCHPWGNLIESKNGIIYGMTSGGGINDTIMWNHGDGVLFSFNPKNNSYKKLYDFKWDKGATPQGSLMQADNGKLYGLTWYGGTCKYGVVFMFNPANNSFTDIHDFNDTTGSYPQGSLVQVNNMLFGMTSHGGVHGYGTIFTIDTATNTFKKIHDFDRVNGALPLGELTEVK